jgi:uncharacterized protein (DUF1697 family)
MEPLVALLRGINVGGKNKIRMVELTSLFEDLGYTGIETYLQSGNVIFEPSQTKEPAEHAEDIKSKVENIFGYKVSVLVLTSKILHTTFTNNPFLKSKEVANSALYVTFLFSTPEPALTKPVELPKNETATFHILEDRVYVCCPGGYGKTKINNQFFEKKLNLEATTRNWKTVGALHERVT